MARMRLGWAATAGFAIVAVASCTILVGENKDFHEVTTGGGGAGGTGSTASSSSSSSTSSSGATASSSSGATMCAQDSDCGEAGPCDVCPPTGKLCLAPLAPLASLADAGCKRVLPTCTPHLPAKCGPVGSFPVGVGPYGIAFDGTNMWVANTDERLDGGTGDGSPSVTVLAPDGGEVQKIILPDGSNPQAIAFDGTNMWVAARDGKVFELSPKGDTLGVFDAGKNPKGIAFDGTNMWVTGFGDQTVTVLSPAGMPVATFQGVGTSPIGIAFDGTNMWVTDQFGLAVLVFPGSGGNPRVVYDGSDGGVHPNGIAFDGTNMWITDDRTSGAVFMLSADPSSMGTLVGSVSMGVNPDRIVFDGTNMWVSNFAGGSVTKLKDGGTFRIGDALTTGPVGIAFDGTHMWVANFGSNTVAEL